MGLVELVKERARTIDEAVKGIKNDPENMLPIISELVKDPKDIVRLIDLIFHVKYYKGATGVWSELAEKHENWYDGTKELLKRINLNVKVEGLENLAKIDKYDSVIFGAPHNHELESLPSLAVAGYYLYHNLDGKKTKIITNVALKAIKNFEEIAFFVKNTGNSDKENEIKKYNRKVFVREIIPFLRDGKGSLIYFLSEVNPHGFIKTEYSKPNDSIKTTAKFADKYVPLYVSWPKDIFISNSLLSRVSRIKLSDDKK